MGRQKHFIAIGEKYGKLTILENVGIIKKYTHYKCQCDCGKITVIRGSGLFGKNATKTCGCLKGQNLIPRNKIKKRKHGLANTPFYNVWVGIKARCNNLKCKEYKWYGGRGITYDPRWNDFLEFKKDMYFSYIYSIKQLKIKQPSIERKDVNGNYCKENCCWIELVEQAGNTRRSKWFIGENIKTKEKIKSKNTMDFARGFDLQSANILKCLYSKRPQHKGWTFRYLTEDEINETIKIKENT